MRIKVDPIHRAQINLLRAGELFMLCAWLQGQMADLLILATQPGSKAALQARESGFPTEMSRVRAGYWEKQFSEVKTEFQTAFRDTLRITENHDLEVVYHIRNAIAHSHISFGRDYLLYRPSGGQKKQDNLLSALGLRETVDSADPVILKLTFWDDEVYEASFGCIRRLDEQCFHRLAGEIDVLHGRIR